MLGTTILVGARINQHYTWLHCYEKPINLRQILQSIIGTNFYLLKIVDVLYPLYIKTIFEVYVEGFSAIYVEKC